MYNLHYTAVIKLCWLPTLNITLTRLDFDLNSDTTVENVADPWHHLIVSLLCDKCFDDGRSTGSETDGMVRV